MARRGAPETRPDALEVVDLTRDSPPRKRKRPTKEASSSRKKFTREDTSSSSRKKTPKEDAPSPSKKNKKSKPVSDDERRLRRWRDHPPASFLQVKDRALTQRMFALERQRQSPEPNHPIEVISLAGTTGNIYTVIIDNVPSCDCPHAQKGNQCKHVCYVLSRVLRVRSELEYQLAFTTSELREIFAHAPPLPSQTSQNENGHRKPIEGECPICMVDLDPDSGESVVYCRAACGNNIHKTCFDQWAASKGHRAVSCPFCRTAWQSDASELSKVVTGAVRGADGYVNVASQLGLSGRRDYSSYHSHWVRNQVRRGELQWDDDGVMEHDDGWSYYA